ncbi:SPFH domain-containing protein [Candidatus Bathyarchaeota archaeon]|nr:SPFH domain-containing protein [Candidatus Bathyarchaeota archaeon]
MSSILSALGIIPANEKGGSHTEWNHMLNPGLIYHLPSNQMRFLKVVLVKEYESGIFLRDGKLYAVVPPGRWLLSRMPVVGKMDFIWVDTGIQRIRFGLRTLTSDGVELGANGVVYLRVSNAEKFIINLVTAKELYFSNDLEVFLRDQLNSIMRAEMGHYDVQSLYLERDMFVSVARVKLDEMFGDIGLEFRSVEIPNFLLPDDVISALRKPLIASKEAQALIQTGTATAQILGKMREAGVDPVQYKAAEALMKYAEKPSGEGSLIGGDLLMPLVFFGVLMKDNSIPKDIKNSLQQMFPKYSDANTNISKPKEEKENTKNKENIQEVLDGLDIRLAKGEISEETYKKLKEKWEAKKEE